MLTSIILEIPSDLILALTSLSHCSEHLSFGSAAGKYSTTHIPQLAVWVNTSAP